MHSVLHIALLTAHLWLGFAQYFQPRWWKDYALDSIDCADLQPTTSAQPFICHDAFFDHCDEVFAPGKELQTFTGIKIFLHAKDVAAFRNASNSIQNPFILITRSNLDELVPYPYSDWQQDLSPAYTALLEHPKLVRWFASNVVVQHPRLVGMPLGPKWQWSSQAFHGEDDTKGALLKVLGRHALDINANFYSQQKTHMILTAMSEASSDGGSYIPWRGSRRQAAKILAQNFATDMTAAVDFAFNTSTLVSIGQCELRRDSELYLLKLQQYRFVLSPPGNGPDCHRTWEALLMGCIPVVLSGPLNAVYEGLPVLILDSWDDLTPSRLTSTYKKFRYGHHTFAFERLFSPYWLGLIDGAKDEAMSLI